MKRALFVACVAVAVIVVGQPAGAVPADVDSPAATGIYTPKAKPPPLPGSALGRGKQSTQSSLLASGLYFYAQGAQVTTSLGAYASFEVAKPAVDTGGHSLAELAVSSADGQNVVEVGWTVDRAVNGDLEPHLFVFSWVNGQEGCYNECGFVPQAGGGGPQGRKLAVGSTLFLSIRHSPGAWWVSADGVGWLGYFPDSLWGGKFTQAGAHQWFGEVNATNSAPCTDMGKGVFASNPSAALISGAGLWDTTATPSLTVAATHPALYTVARVTANQIRYGGPGAC